MNKPESDHLTEPLITVVLDAIETQLSDFEHEDRDRAADTNAPLHTVDCRLLEEAKALLKKQRGW
jgi:hypothetical protein